MTTPALPETPPFEMALGIADDYRIAIDRIISAAIETADDMLGKSALRRVQSTLDAITERTLFDLAMLNRDGGRIDAIIRGIVQAVGSGGLYVENANDMFATLSPMIEAVRARRLN